MNAIVVYMVAELGETTLHLIKVSGMPLHRYLFDHLYAPFLGPKIDSMMWGMSVNAAVFLVAWIMYRRKWFVKI